MRAARFKGGMTVQTAIDRPGADPREGPLSCAHVPSTIQEDVETIFSGKVDGGRGITRRLAAKARTAASLSSGTSKRQHRVAWQAVEERGCVRWIDQFAVSDDLAEPECELEAVRSDVARPFPQQSVNVRSDALIPGTGSLSHVVVREVHVAGFVLASGRDDCCHRRL